MTLTSLLCLILVEISVLRDPHVDYARFDCARQAELTISDAVVPSQFFLHELELLPENLQESYSDPFRNLLFRRDKVISL